MSQEDAEELLDRFEKWDAKNARHNFITRMERKLYRKEHANR